jgi:hypothetical protein
MLCTNFIYIKKSHLSLDEYIYQVVDAQNSPSVICHLMIGRGWVKLVLMGRACLMADGALISNLLLC